MLDKNQETRLTVKQIKNHPWFNSMLPKNAIITPKKPQVAGNKKKNEREPLVGTISLNMNQ